MIFVSPIKRVQLSLCFCCCCWPCSSCWCLQPCCCLPCCWPSYCCCCCCWIPQRFTAPTAVFWRCSSQAGAARPGGFRCYLWFSFRLDCTRSNFELSNPKHLSWFVLLAYLYHAYIMQILSYYTYIFHIHTFMYMYVYLFVSTHIYIYAVYTFGCPPCQQ